MAKNYRICEVIELSGEPFVCIFHGFTNATAVAPGDINVPSPVAICEILDGEKQGKVILTHPICLKFIGFTTMEA